MKPFLLRFFLKKPLIEKIFLTFFIGEFIVLSLVFIFLFPSSEFFSPELINSNSFFSSLSHHKDSLYRFYQYQKIAMDICIGLYLLGSIISIVLFSQKKWKSIAKTLLIGILLVLFEIFLWRFSTIAADITDFISNFLSHNVREWGEDIKSYINPVLVKWGIFKY